MILFQWVDEGGRDTRGSEGTHPAVRRLFCAYCGWVVNYGWLDQQPSEAMLWHKEEQQASLDSFLKGGVSSWNLDWLKPNQKIQHGFGKPVQRQMWVNDLQVPESLGQLLSSQDKTTTLESEMRSGTNSKASWPGCSLALKFVELRMNLLGIHSSSLHCQGHHSPP